MLNIREFRGKDKVLSDLLNLAFMVGEYTVAGRPCAVALNKDGSLMSGFHFAGPDLESLSTGDIERLSAGINAAIARLGGGWSSHFTAIRLPAEGYIDPEDNHFADPVSQLIDDERRQQFAAENAHFLSRYAVVFTWQTPPDSEVAAGELFVERKNVVEKQSFESVIRKFAETLDGVAGMLGHRVKLRPMQERDLLTHYHECLTGKPHPVNPPPVPAYLDTMLGHHEFVGGLEPMLDDQHVRVVTFTGFPLSTQPELLESLHNLPFPLRYTTRFVALDQKDAKKAIDAYKVHWLGARFSARDYLGAAISRGHMPEQNANADATAMMADATAALAEASAGLVRYGYFTATVVLFGRDLKELNERLRLVEAHLNNAGFVAFRESTNAVEAFLGSLPGHTWENVRKFLIHSLNAVDMSPKTAIWAGSRECPSPLMRDNGKPAPCLTFGKTTGGTPFRFNLHVSDLGHTLITGPTGAGKSAALALLAAQWLRYRNARVICFDKGRSMYALTEAVGGQHYDILGELSDLTFAPLDRINESDIERGFAENWLESLAVLQGMHITPREREAIHHAVAGLASEEGRSITDVQALIQHSELKAAIGFYAGTGRAGMLLDARHDTLDLSSRFICFELEHLLQSGEAAKLITVPTLLYLFHRIEQMLDGRPTLITLDEAWVMLDNEQFLTKIREWLKVLRKKNAAVVFATQSLADLKDSPLRPVLQESCPTKIFLPNVQAGSQNLKPLYLDFGLEDRQIELLQQSTPKRDYYVFTPEGQRRVNFDLEPATLAFCGVSDPRDVKRVAELKAAFGPKWPVEWLREKLPAHLKDGWVRYAEDLYRKKGISYA